MSHDRLRVSCCYYLQGKCCFGVLCRNGIHELLGSASESGCACHFGDMCWLGHRSSPSPFAMASMMSQLQDPDGDEANQPDNADHGQEPKTQDHLLLCACLVALQPQTRCRLSSLLSQNHWDPAVQFLLFLSGAWSHVLWIGWSNRARHGMALVMQPIATDVADVAGLANGTQCAASLLTVSSAYATNVWLVRSNGVAKSLRRWRELPKEARGALSTKISLARSLAPFLKSCPQAIVLVDAYTSYSFTVAGSGVGSAFGSAFGTQEVHSFVPISRID